METVGAACWKLLENSCGSMDLGSSWDIMCSWYCNLWENVCAENLWGTAGLGSSWKTAGAGYLQGNAGNLGAENLWGTEGPWNCL